MENPNLYEGDMLLTPEQLRLVKEGPSAFASINLKERMWPGPIPYSYDEKIGASGQAVWAIQQAIKDYHKYTCIRYGEINHISYQTKIRHTKNPSGKRFCQKTFTSPIQISSSL